jgi:NADH-ubiquinone oxidoreductase chain 2
MLLSSIFSLLLSNALSSKNNSAILYSRIGILVLFYCMYLSYNNLFVEYLDNGLGLFGGLFSTSSIIQIFHIFIFVLSLLILYMTGFYPLTLFNKLFTWQTYNLNVELNIITNSYFKNYKETFIEILEEKGLLEQYTKIEYTLIILFIIIGSVLLISSSDLVSIFLSIELQSYGLYLLCAVYRNSESSTSASLTYFLLGGLASCFILLGIGLIYANLGVTYLDSFYIVNNLYNITNEENTYKYISYIPYYIIIMVVGFLFKISAAPFHFWSPDVYDGVPTIVTTMVVIVAKISILVLILQLVYYTNNLYIYSNYSWTLSLLLSSLLSLIIGTILGLTQIRIKRLYAYSTISHLGFMLLALGINSIESVQSFIFYIIQYSISNLNAFMILIGIGYSLFHYYDVNINHINLIDKNNSPIQLISQLKGYFYINSILALSLAITLFSFAGIPPLMGFFAKQMIFYASIQEGFIFITLIAILTSVISAVYYLFIVKTMFFENHYYKLENKKISKKLYNIIRGDGTYFKITLSNSFSIIISILTLIILLFMFMPNEWLYLSNILSITLFIPINI